MQGIQIEGRVVTLPLTTETDLLCENMAAPDTKGVNILDQSFGFAIKNSHGVRNIASIAVYWCYERSGTRWVADSQIVLAAALTPGSLVAFSLPRRAGAQRLRLTATSAAGGSEATLDFSGSIE